MDWGLTRAQKSATAASVTAAMLEGRELLCTASDRPERMLHRASKAQYTSLPSAAARVLHQRLYQGDESKRVLDTKEFTATDQI